MKFMVTDEALEALERECSELGSDARDDDRRLALRVEIAWHLRQRFPLAAERSARSLDAELALAPSPVQQSFAGRLALVMAEVDLQMSRLDAARSQAARARPLFESALDGVGVADALFVAGLVEHDAGDREASSALLGAAAVRARVVGDDTRARLFDGFEAIFAASASIVAADARWRSFVDKGLVDTARQGSDLRALGDDAALLAVVHDYVGTVAINRGDNRIGLESLTIAVDAYRWVGQERRATVCACNAASALSNLVDHAGALERIDETLERARQRGVPRHIGICLVQSAHTLCELGNVDAAREQILEAREALAGLTRIASYTVLLQVLGEVEFALGNLEQALQAYRAQEEHALASGSTTHQVLALRQQVEVYVALGQHERALEIGQSALTLVRLLGNALVESEILFVMASAYAPGSTAPVPESPWPDGEIHFLHRALDVATAAGLPIRSDLLSGLAQAHARRQDFEVAYGFSSRAATARRAEYTEQTANRAIAMEVRHRVQRARTLMEHHQQLAREQAARADVLTRTSDTLALLGIVGREVTAHLDDRSIFEALGRHLCGLLDASSFAIFLLSEDGLRLELAHGVEDGLPLLVPVVVSIDDPEAGTALCARTREEVFRTRGSDEPAQDQRMAGTLYTRSALYSPLLVGERLLGVMTLQSERGDAYGHRERLVLRTLSAYGAIALGNARTYKQLEQANARLSEMSLTDPLTGLRNRRFLLQQLDADIALCLRAYEDARPALPVSDDLAFFMIDLDHFKQVNDTYGHPVGDAVLAQMRDRLVQACRDGDYLARWGGEEFMVVTRRVSRNRVPALGERLRRVVCASPFVAGDASLAVTASIGFACFPSDPLRPAAAGWQEVVELADRALYEAKQSGRNTVRGVA